MALARVSAARPHAALRKAGPARRAPGAVGAAGGRRAVRPRAGATEVAQLALEMDSDTILLVVAGVAGIGAGIGIPAFFMFTETRDKERVAEIREMNRATLKATGETMSEDEIAELRPTRYLDRREFRDDD